MKNLRKVLALVLVVAMFMSFATGISAKFTDDSKITYKEAVDVMAGIGVINGFTDGSFKPADTLTRAQMAKMVAYITAGGEDVGPLYASANTFTDCNAHWAKGYIAYASKTGIVAGTGKGKFNPEGTLTGTQAAKMLLVALGYDPGIEQYVGVNWEVNTLARARDVGLLKGMEKVNMGAALSREAAAQMCFNALKADTVKYATKGSSIIVGGVEINQGASSAQRELWIGNEGVNHETGLKSTKDETIQLCEKQFPSLKKVEAEANGVAGFKWSYKSNEISGFISSEVSLATTFKGATFEKLTTKGNSAYIGYKYDDVVQVYVNGAQKKTDTVATTGHAAGDGKYVMTDTADKTLVAAFVNAATAGQTVDFIDVDDNGKFDKINITEYSFTKITATTPEKANGDEATITVAGFGKIKESAVIGKFSSLAKDDYVMCAATKTDGVNSYIVYKAESFNGTMTRYNTGDKTMTIGGTVYNTSTAAVNNTSMTAAAAFTGNKEAKFYTDANGLIVAVDGVNADAKYAIIDSIAYVAGTGANPENRAEAKLIFNDATTKVVTLNYDVLKVVTGSTGTADLSDYKTTSGGSTSLPTNAGIGIYLGYEGTSAKNILVASATASENTEALANSIYTYTTNSNNEYTLKADSSYTAATSSNLTKGSPVVANGVANNNTVYVYKTKSGSKDVFAAYTGYKNAPSTIGANNIIDYVKTTADGMILVYVNATGAGSSVGDTSSDVAYFWNNNYSIDNSGDTALYEYEAIVNGEKKTLVATQNLSVSANTLYKVELNDKGQATKVDSAAGANYTLAQANGDVSASSGIMTIDPVTLANGTTAVTTIAFDDNTVFYSVSKDGKTVDTTTAGSIVDDTQLYIKTKGDNSNSSAADKITATVVYILAD